MGGLRPPDAVRASAHARLGREVPEDLPGGVDRHTGWLVRFQIRGGRAEHGAEPGCDHLEELGAIFDLRGPEPTRPGAAAVRLRPGDQWSLPVEALSADPIRG